jgi:hypothetical protein
VIKAGTRVTQQKIDQVDVLWFEPGIHDLSIPGKAPSFETPLRGGQTVYLAGGSYLKARFWLSDSPH